MAALCVGLSIREWRKINALTIRGKICRFDRIFMNAAPINDGPVFCGLEAGHKNEDYLASEFCDQRSV